MYIISKIIRMLYLCSEDDSNWPAPDRVGKQELEIVLGDEHISFSVRKNKKHKKKTTQSI